MKERVNEHGWDGDWYRRAYFDDGAMLGSIHNIDCKIDSIAQSWSVLSGGGEPERAERPRGRCGDPAEAVPPLFRGAG